MFTVKEVAKQLSVEPNTVYTWIRKGKLNVTKLGNTQHSRVRITQEQLDEFMQD